MSPIRLLIFGGRGYPYESLVHEGILRLAAGIPFTQITIIHGDCNRDKRVGADYWAHTFCELWRAKGVTEQPFPAQWRDLEAPNALIRVRRSGERYNARAGFDRNQRMLDEGKPTHALGFPGGSGTADMLGRIRRAIARGVSIELYLSDNFTSAVVPWPSSK